MTFFDRLRQLRREHKLTQLELAQVINVTDRSMRRYEAGTMEPTLSVIIALSDFFDVSTDFLLGRSDTRERQP